MSFDVGRRKAVEISGQFEQRDHIFGEEMILIAALASRASDVREFAVSFSHIISHPWLLLLSGSFSFSRD
jgi:hypothetical protein